MLASTLIVLVLSLCFASTLGEARVATEIAAGETLHNVGDSFAGVLPAWTASQEVQCVPRPHLEHLRDKLLWPTRQLQPTLAKGGAGFMVAYNALAQMAPDSPPLPLAEVATPDVDLLAVVHDTVVAVRPAVGCHAAAGAAWGVLVDAARKWGGGLDGPGDEPAAGAVAAVLAAEAAAVAAGDTVPAVTYIALLLHEVHASVPHTTAPEHAPRPQLWRHQCALGVRGAAVAAAALLQECESVLPGQSAALAALTAEPVWAFDAICTVGDLTHTVGELLGRKPHWFEVPTYERVYMDNVHWLHSDDARVMAWNASERYGLGVLDGVPATEQEALVAVTVQVPGWGMVLSPAVLVGVVLDGLSNTDLNVKKLRAHPAADALGKLQRRLARLRHAVRVNHWLMQSGLTLGAGVGDSIGLGDYILPQDVLSAAASVEVALSVAPLGEGGCMAVLVREEDEEETDLWYSDSEVPCDHPAAYVDARDLPIAFHSVSCPELVGICGNTMT